MAESRLPDSPTPVSAAGGILLRAGSSEILLIRRRGLWDLPKGKQMRGESIEACARREVCEELGIPFVEILEPLGTTVHDYVDTRKGTVRKTTHWFLMASRTEAFRPQEAERIDRVEWVNPAEARSRLAFDNLRDLVERARGRLGDG